MLRQKDVTININRAAVATNVGTWMPLIFAGKNTSAIAYTVCRSLEDVIITVGGITPSDTEQQKATKTAAAKATGIYKAAQLMLMQNDAPAEFAICASTAVTTTGIVDVLAREWRQLIVVSIGVTGEDTAKAISDYIETTDKLFFVSATSTSGVTSTNERTIWVVHDDVNDVEHPESAVVGATAGKPAGSINYKNMEVRGLTPPDITDAQLDAIRAVNGIALIYRSGKVVTSDGKTASGEYIDILDGIDFVVQGITNETEAFLISADKVKYDNTGIAQLENICYDVLSQAASQDIIAIDDNVPQFTVDYKPRSETRQADRAARRYVEGNFTFSLAGAIDTVVVNGTVEI